MSRISMSMNEDAREARALAELEALLDRRIRSAQNGAVSERTVGGIFRSIYRKNKTK
jgi:hypothetical protein